MNKKQKENEQLIKDHSNYEIYRIMPDKSMGVDEERLVAIIQACKALLPKPYLRFMWASYFEEAACVVYNNQESQTKLIQISELEKMLKSKRLHK